MRADAIKICPSVASLNPRLIRADDTTGPYTPAAPNSRPKKTGTPGSFSQAEDSARHAPEPNGSALRACPVLRYGVEHRHAHRIALVARTLPEAQSIMIEGESGLLNICPPSNKPTYEPSKRKLTWPSGAFALAFSSHEPDQLRGPQFDAAWCDELASWEYPNQTWDNLNFALRLGRRPRSVVTTTPKPIELVRSLPNKPRRVRHPWLHLRKPGQPSPLILQGHHRPVRRHSNRHGRRSTPSLWTRTKTPSGNASG